MEKVDESIKKSLKVLNLTDYETKIWITILSKGIADPKEISNITSIPRSRTYEVLDSLEKKGFIMLKLGKPKKYISISPKKIIQLAKNKEKTSMEKEINRIEKVEEEIIGKLDNIYNRNKKEDISTENIISITNGKSKQLENIKMLIKSTEKQIKIFTEVELLEDIILLFKKDLNDLINRNVDVKIITKINSKKKKELIREEINFIKIKEIEQDIKKGFIIVDGKEINFTSLKDDNNKKQSFWVNTSFFGKALSKMFDIAWKNGELITGASKKNKVETKKRKKIKI